ncbi:MAG: hypothetical protein JO002_01290 [Burkholderiaceae bacterium]|nr:hypothetical protein [Burkholderiaceae bacterium]
MNALPVLLALWRIGVVSDSEVEAWVNSELAHSDNPSEALLDLACHGPAICMSWAEHVFPIRPFKLRYQDEFALRALVLNLNVDEELGRFASWVVDACRYEDRKDELVRFGYELDALFLEYCDESGAVAQLRQHLPVLKPRLLDSARALAELVPGLVPSRLQAFS